jgi:pimeloyl-ACP methyl ester carboxylesterase
VIRDIVLIHGGGQAAWVWDETVAAMRMQAGAALGRVIALDVPGCGAKRGRDTTGLAVEHVVAELAGELDGLGVTDALLVGHSQAGTLLPGLIAVRPVRFARAVFFSCCAPLPGQTVGAMMGRGPRGANEAEVGWPLDPASVNRRALFAAAFCNDMMEAEASAFLDKLGRDEWPAACALESDRWHYDEARGVPGTYVVALRDNILPLAWQERFAERFHAGCRVSIDAGHQAMNSRPHALAEILLKDAA